MNDAILQLHHFLPFSRANGPGVRAVVWVQGCSLGCAGCFNPETHAFGGQSITVDDLFERIIALGASIEGISISGGEPLQQPAAVTRLIRRVKTETSLSIVLFSGLAWEEVRRLADSPIRRFDFLHYVDILLAGRYDRTQRLARELRGSVNKTVHFLSSRYTMNDLQSVPEAEVIIGTDGEMTLSGIEPLRL